MATDEPDAAVAPAVTEPATETQTPATPPPAPAAAPSETPDAAPPPPTEPAARVPNARGRLQIVPREEQGATVIGSASHAIQRTPGSVTVIRREDLRHLAPQHAGDALRTVPGLNVVAEDGIGLRLNIGIRGLDPNRSRKVLILEDGMPVSLNPYGSPELYYSPPIERMDRVEVVRGSGQILSGPQTIGGVINYVTRDPPRAPSVSGDVRYGSYGYVLAQAGAGATHGAIGWRVDVIHRRFDGPRQLGLALTDVTARLRLQLAPQSVLRVKVNFYDETSRATYVGLTTPQFNLDPAINTASHDRFVVRRYAFALMHSHRFSETLSLQTNFYAYQTNRAWRRQEFDRTDAGIDYERICDPSGHCGPRGATDVSPTSDGASLYFRRSAAIRNRTFSVAGIEPRATWNWSASPAVTGELIALARLHYEAGREQVLIATSPTAESGDPHDEEIRNGYALATAIQNRISFWNRLHVTPGVRIENFWSDRRIVRVPVMAPGGGTVGSDVNIFGQAFSWAFIPGLGVSVDTTRSITLFSGIHRGYAPPRTRDAVSPAGQNLQLDPELSWNSEMGARFRFGRLFTADAAVFEMEFENQIIPPSEAGGAAGVDFNAGHSRHAGVEMNGTFDVAQLLPAASFSLPLTVNYTWVPLAAFVGGLYDGNRLPYAPEHLLYAQLRFAHRSGFYWQVGVNYISAQFADRDNTPFPSADGLVGRIPDYVTLDCRIAYAWRRTGFTFSLTGRNLTDQAYIASRAPQGIQPAGFRQIFAGIEWALPGS